MCVICLCGRERMISESIIVSFLKPFSPCQSLAELWTREGEDDVVIVRIVKKKG